MKENKVGSKVGKLQIFVISKYENRNKIVTTFTY